MKKIIAVILIVSFLSLGVFAEEKKAEIVTIEYKTEQKTAITIWSAIMFFIAGVIAKELVVDGAYGVRD